MGHGLQWNKGTGGRRVKQLSGVLVWLFLLIAAQQALGQQTVNSDDVISAIRETEQLYSNGQFDAALELGEQALALAVVVLGERHPETLRAESNLASIYEVFGRWEDAETSYKRVLDQRTEVLGPNHPATLVSANKMGGFHTSRGNYQEAEFVLRETLGRAMATFGDFNELTAGTKSNLAVVLRRTGQFEEARRLYQEAISAFSRGYGVIHPSTLTATENLAQMELSLGNFADSERLLISMVEARSASGAGGAPAMANSLNLLSGVYVETGRFEVAEGVARRAYELMLGSLGPDHLQTIEILHDLGVILHHLGRHEEAGPLLTQAAERFESILGTVDPSTLSAINNLGSHYEAVGNYAAAEIQYNRALSLQKQILGDSDPATQSTANNLARIYGFTGRPDEARELFQSLLESNINVLGLGHPDTLKVILNAAYFAQSYARIYDAEDLHRLAIQGLVSSRFMRNSETFTYFSKTVAATHGSFHLHLLTELGSEVSSEGLSAGLLGSQFGRAESAGRAVDAAAARLAARDAAIGARVRALDEVNGRLVGLEGARTNAFAEGNSALAATLSERIVEAEAEAAVLSDAIQNEFPAYAALAAPRFLEAGEVLGEASLLQPGEALVIFVEAEQNDAMEAQWLAMVARRDGLAAVRLPGAPEVVARQVTAVRASVAVNGNGVPQADFDLESAHDLYQALFAPLEPHLAGIDHVLVVPDGPLQSLPLDLLVTDLPGEGLTGGAAYRDAGWLGERYAITVLPAASSLRALRETAGEAAGEAPLLALADPAFTPRARPRVDMQIASAADSFSSVCDLPPIPATGRIAQSLQAALGAGSDAVIEGGAASEATLRDLNADGRLRAARIVAFNTHGLTAAELAGRAEEPALALTPAGGCGGDGVPMSEDPANDGFLTVSEIVELELDADWVLLTACNTAAGDGQPGAEPLSGLARGFFYAGARELLVSHWPATVSSDVIEAGPTELLIEALFDPANNTLSKAQALQAARANVRATFPHPTHWATFSLIGDGR